MFELIFTSAPHGLFPGKSGFSTVAMTEGMPPDLITPLENLSGYNFTYQGSQLPEALNPVCCYYLKMRYGSRILSIAGRVAPNGLDHTRRNNKIAHHILLESTAELTCQDGAAGLFLHPQQIFAKDFSGAPRELSARALPHDTAELPLQACTWESYTQDAGTAGWIAEKFRTQPDQSIYVKYPQGTPVEILLKLASEVCVLLSPRERTDFTFNTYFNNITAGMECFLRFIPDFSPLVSNLERFHAAELVDLSKNVPPPAFQMFANCELAELARHGYAEQPEQIVDEDFPAAPDAPDMESLRQTPEAPRSRLSLKVDHTPPPPPSSTFRNHLLRHTNDEQAAKKTINLKPLLVILLALVGVVFLFFAFKNKNGEPVKPTDLETNKSIAENTVSLKTEKVESPKNENKSKKKTNSEQEKLLPIDKTVAKNFQPSDEKDLFFKYWKAVGEMGKNRNFSIHFPKEALYSKQIATEPQELGKYVKLKKQNKHLILKFDFEFPQQAKSLQKIYLASADGKTVYCCDLRYDKKYLPEPEKCGTFSIDKDFKIIFTPANNEVKILLDAKFLKLRVGKKDAVAMGTLPFANWNKAAAKMQSYKKKIDDLQQEIKKLQKDCPELPNYENIKEDIKDLKSAAQRIDISIPYNDDDDAAQRKKKKQDKLQEAKKSVAAFNNRVKSFFDKFTSVKNKNIKALRRYFERLEIAKLPEELRDSIPKETRKEFSREIEEYYNSWKVMADNVIKYCDASDELKKAKEDAESHKKTLNECKNAIKQELNNYPPEVKTAVEKEMYDKTRTPQVITADKLNKILPALLSKKLEIRKE